MFLPFFEELRRHRVPATLREFLDFLGLVKTGDGGNGGAEGGDGHGSSKDRGKANTPR